MAVSGVGRSSGVSSAKSSSPITSASLSADAGGNLTLTPVGDKPINISKGREGRYHVDVDGQDIAFTPEQMKRLDIDARAGNPVKLAHGVDIPVKINGVEHERGVDGAARAKGKGFESIPHIAGDRFDASTTSGAGAPQGSAALEQAGKVDANRSVKGNNWDSAGVPHVGKAGEGGKDAAKAPEQAKDAKEAEEEKKKKKAKEKKVEVVHLVQPGEDKVNIKNEGDTLKIEFIESLERWKRMMANMAGEGEGNLVPTMGDVQSQVAGELFQQGLQQMAERPRSSDDTAPADDNRIRDR